MATYNHYLTGEQKKERDALICERYAAGETFKVLEREFHLTRQWIHIILKNGGIEVRPRSYSRVNRDTFLGANINSDTKAKLEALADKEGVSVSALTEAALKELVERADN